MENAENILYEELEYHIVIIKTTQLNYTTHTHTHTHTHIYIYIYISVSNNTNDTFASVDAQVSWMMAHISLFHIL